MYSIYHAFVARWDAGEQRRGTLALLRSFPITRCNYHQNAAAWRVRYFVNFDASKKYSCCKRSFFFFERFLQKLFPKKIISHIAPYINGQYFLADILCVSTLFPLYILYLFY